MPLFSEECDPLKEAVQAGHKEVVFLLLCAGAPLCAHDGSGRWRRKDSAKLGLV